MNNRRTLLKAGLALPFAAAWGRSALSQTPTFDEGARLLPSIELAVVDRQFAASAAFAEEASQRGVPLHTIDSSVTDVWLRLLQRREQLPSRVLMGFTSEQSLFCLDLMTRDFGLRIVHRADATAANDRWARSAARLALAQAENARSALPANLGPALVQKASSPIKLSSWVIAPAARAILQEPA